MQIVSLGGKLMKADEALISIDERGFRFGDGVFETIPVHAGVPYLLEYHLERLQLGLSALHIPCDIASYSAAIHEVIAANALTRGMVRLYVSRGIGSQGYLPTSATPTVLVQTVPLPEIPKEPVSLWLSTWEKISPRALPVNYKLAQGINATLARMQAREQGCFEALQLSAGGHVSEASSANIFWLKQGTLYTPSLPTGALAGVTRRRVMELAAGAFMEGEFTLEHLQGADGVFLTNAACGIVPVRSLLPMHSIWEDSALIFPFSTALTNDINDYTSRRR
jgi:branched-subunit amino acid aminotransferase/4-amino-4-deoxychorismate lyase